MNFAYKPEVVMGNPGYEIHKYSVPDYRFLGVVERGVSDADIDTFLAVLEGTDAKVLEPVTPKAKFVAAPVEEAPKVWFGKPAPQVKPLVKFKVTVSCHYPRSKAVVMIPLTQITWDDRPGAKPYAVKKIWRPSNEQSLKTMTPLLFSKVAAEAVADQMVKNFRFIKAEVVPVTI